MGGKNKRLRDNFLVVILVAFLAVAFGEVIAHFIKGWFGAGICATFGTIIAIIIYIAIARIEVLGRFWLGYGNNNLLMLIWGLVSGVLWYILTVVVISVKTDLVFRVHGMGLFAAISLFISVFVTALMQEIVCRGFIYQFFLGRYDSIIAILFNTLFYVVISNISLTGIITSAGYVLNSTFALNMFLLGLALTFAVHYRGSFFYALMFNTAWNFTSHFLPGVMESWITSLMFLVLLVILYLRGRGIRIRF